MQVKTIRPGEADFLFYPDEITICPRAGLEISLECPDKYKSIIADAFNKGWLKPIAHIPVHEHFMEKLTK